MTVRVVHVIASLGLGGAETALFRLLAGTDPGEFPSAVITLLPRSETDQRVGDLGVEVVNLNGARGRIPGLPVWRALAHHVRRLQPDVLQGWMYHGNVAASYGHLVAARRSCVVWNIRHSLHAFALETRITRQTIRFNALLSRAPDRIVYNSWISRRQHESRGFAAGRACVIPNGFDTRHLAPRAGVGGAFRAELGLAADARVVSYIARLHPGKGHVHLLDAARRMTVDFPDLQVLLVGPEDRLGRRDLEAMIAERGLQEHVRYLGTRHDVERVYAASNVFCSPSLGEGFPNVVGEAMACGVPCVVTDVGDCARIVGDTGIVVATADPAALAAGLAAVLGATAGARDELGRRARERVVNEYGIDRVVREYADLYRRFARPTRTMSEERG